MKTLEVGDVIYETGGDLPISKTVVERITPNMAIAKNGVRFRREYDETDPDPVLTKINRGLWDVDRYQLETQELKYRYDEAVINRFLKRTDWISIDMDVKRQIYHLIKNAPPSSNL